MNGKFSHIFPEYVWKCIRGSFFFFLNLHFLFAMKSNKSNFFQNNLSYMYTVSGIRVELFPYFPLHMYKCFIRFKFCVPIYALHIYKAINWNDIVLGRFYKILMRSNSREKYHLNFFPHSFSKIFCLNTSEILF